MMCSEHECYVAIAKNVDRNLVIKDSDLELRRRLRNTLIAWNEQSGTPLGSVHIQELTTALLLTAINE